jgi:hypothetical protein
VPTKKKFKRPLRHHLDRRAAQILAALKAIDRDQWTTRQVSELFAISEEWLQVARIKGFGPPCTKVRPRLVLYPRNGLIKWLKQRMAVR